MLTDRHIIVFMPPWCASIVPHEFSYFIFFIFAVFSLYKNTHPFSYLLQHTSWVYTASSNTVWTTALQDRQSRKASIIHINIQNKSGLSLSITVWCISSFTQLVIDWLHQHGHFPTFPPFFFLLQGLRISIVLLHTRAQPIYSIYIRL